MKIFISELGYLSELYSRLSHEFLDQSAGSTQDCPWPLSSAILQNVELFTRIEQMNSRLQQLAEEWDEFRDQMDPATREIIRALALSSKETAMSLAQRCRKRMQALEVGMEQLQNEMESLQKGARYLQTMSPLKANYPKFIDSRS